jgi:hypothetical protein
MEEVQAAIDQSEGSLLPQRPRWPSNDLLWCIRRRARITEKLIFGHDRNG